MHNLLTGKQGHTEYPDPSPNALANDSWTAEAHLNAARRLLDAGGRGDHDVTANLIAAARVHVEAAKAVAVMPTRTLPRDGDAI